MAQTQETVTVQNGQHVSTIVVSSPNHTNVVHVYHPQPEDKQDDKRRN